MTADSGTIQIRVTQEYLEMARAASDVKTNRQHTDASKQDKDVTDLWRTTQIAFLSASIIYSYLAVEAFMNWQLYRMDVEKFEKLRWTGVKTRIRELCKCVGIRPIHDLDKELWNCFKTLVRDARHFLVHPRPDPDFDKIIKQLLSKEPIYPEIASRIIAHFFTETKMPIPSWLRKSELFETLTTDLLF